MVRVLRAGSIVTGATARQVVPSDEARITLVVTAEGAGSCRIGDKAGAGVTLTAGTGIALDHWHAELWVVAVSGTPTLRFIEQLELAIAEAPVVPDAPWEDAFAGQGPEPMPFAVLGLHDAPPLGVPR